MCKGHERGTCCQCRPRYSLSVPICPSRLSSLYLLLLFSGSIILMMISLMKRCIGMWMLRAMPTREMGHTILIYIYLSHSAFGAVAYLSLHTADILIVFFDAKRTLRYIRYWCSWRIGRVNGSVKLSHVLETIVCSVMHRIGLFYTMLFVN